MDNQSLLYTRWRSYDRGNRCIGYVENAFGMKTLDTLYWSNYFYIERLRRTFPTDQNARSGKGEDRKGKGRNEKAESGGREGESREEKAERRDMGSSTA